MNNGLDIAKYLHSINSNAAINAAINTVHQDKESNSESTVNMQFNNDTNGTKYTKSWIS